MCRYKIWNFTWHATFLFYTCSKTKRFWDDRLAKRTSESGAISNPFEQAILCWGDAIWHLRLGLCALCLKYSNSVYILSDFINLTQVHNFTVSAQYIFTFRRISVFTVSFTGILQLLMQIMKRFVPSYWLVKWLWYRVYNQKVVSSSQSVCVCFYFYLYSIRLILIIIDVPRPLRNEISDHSISKGWCVTRKMSQTVRNIFWDYWKILFHIIAKTYG